MYVVFIVKYVCLVVLYNLPFVFIKKLRYFVASIVWCRTNLQNISLWDYWCCFRQSNALCDIH